MNYSLSSENVLRDGWHAFFTDGRGCLLSYAGPGKEVKIPKGVWYIGVRCGPPVSRGISARKPSLSATR